jgi:hypothetical protein
MSWRRVNKPKDPTLCCECQWNKIYNKEGPTGKILPINARLCQECLERAIRKNGSYERLRRTLTDQESNIIAVF